MKSIITLNNFMSVRPTIQMRQEETLARLEQIHAAGDDDSASNRDRIQKMIRRYGVKSSVISQREFEDTDIAAQGSDIYQRAQFFGIRALEVFQNFYGPSAKAPGHIVHVTCTGYLSPSPAQKLVSEKSWAGQTNVTHAYHMGCYAALPAVRMAEGFMAAKKHSCVDIVHTEMCGLHMDGKDHSPEQLVVQSLFADGHIKYSAVSSQSTTPGFQVLCVREEIVPNSHADMSWTPASWGMKMNLSREVPAKISASLRQFVQKLAEESHFGMAELLKHAIFAVHPGGPKIIDAVRETLELTEAQVATSREVLRERGNMSSATLPHVWKSLLEQRISSGQPVVSLAFGPGLTIFGALFATC